MHPVRTTLATTTNPLVLVALVWALVWSFGATQIALPTHPASPPQHGAASALGGLELETVWQSSWSRRFPGCVALALWPRDEQPVAVVTRGADGGVARVAPAAHRPGRVVGACR